MMLRTLAVVLVLSALPALANDHTAELQALLDRFAQTYAVPGATAAIAMPDGTIVSAATGLADVEAGTPMTPDTRMLAASIGKSFVATTLLALERDGLLSRDDLVSSHLGNRAWFARLPNADTMTINDLLRHTAGLVDHVHLDTFAADMRARVASGADAPPIEQAIAFAIDTEPLFPAGTAWSYSDTGYLLLGLIIEQATGRSYYQEVTERFLKPLGLTATAPSNERRLPGLAVGYTGEDNPFGMPLRTMNEGGELVWDPAVEWTGGGLLSTSHDLALWGHALFGGEAFDTPYLADLFDGFTVAPDAPGILYGAGIAIYADTPSGPVYGHGGWTPGYVSSLRHYADHGVTVAFQINTDVGIADDSTDLVPALEAALADFAIGLGKASEPE